MKLIVLDRLMTLKDVPAHERVLQDLVMDILRVLASPDLEVRKKTLSLVLDLISPRNVEEVSLSESSFDNYCNSFGDKLLVYPLVFFLHNF